MPFDFVSSPARQSRKARGLTNYLAGHAAEASVARHYEDRGIAICARNWRGISGEIDLIGRDGDVVVFIEVKQSKTHDLAASHVSQGQIGRIFATGAERWSMAWAASRWWKTPSRAELHLPAASAITSSERRSEPCR